VPLALVLAAVLAAENPAEEHAMRAEETHGKLIALTAGAVLLGTGAALGSWVDREGTFGRVSAITAGTLATGVLAASLGAFITSRLFLGRANAKTLLEVASDILEYSVSVAVASIVSGLVGLGVGALVSGFASAPPGTPRGVFGVVSGSVLAATGVSVLIVAW
jgi:hypothetical protein